MRDIKKLNAFTLQKTELHSSCEEDVHPNPASTRPLPSGHRSIMQSTLFLTLLFLTVVNCEEGTFPTFKSLTLWSESKSVIFTLNSTDIHCGSVEGDRHGRRSSCPELFRGPIWTCHSPYLDPETKPRSCDGPWQTGEVDGGGVIGLWHDSEGTRGFLPVSGQSQRFKSVTHALGLCESKW